MREENNAAVSVVIPVYNVELYLRECLDSVIHQTFSDMEILIIDDGSTDGSGAICDEYCARDSRICVVHRKNGGLGSARNAGMDIAKGKYIIFLDSDDYLDTDALTFLYSEAEKNELQLLQFSGEAFWDGLEPEQEKMSMYTHEVQNAVVKRGADSLRTAKQSQEYYAQACMRLYLLQYLKGKDLRFDEGIIHEDESFSFFAFMFADRVECVGQRFYKRRFRPGSIMTSRTLQKSALGYAVAMDHVLQVYQSQRISDDETRQLYIEQIRQYLTAIRSFFAKTRRRDRADGAVIEKETFPYRQGLSCIRPALTISERLAIKSLLLADCMGYISIKKARLKRYCVSLVRKK